MTFRQVPLSAWFHSQTAVPGGIARELRIKVGNMEPACCEWNYGGTSADTLFLSACR